MFSIYPLIWSIACTLVGMAVVLRAALIKRLRDQHPTVWEELGSPSPIGVSAESLWGWVWRREYAKLIPRRFALLPGIGPSALYFCWA
jgi:hypothetical protein